MKLNLGLKIFIIFCISRFRFRFLFVDFERFMCEKKFIYFHGFDGTEMMSILGEKFGDKNFIMNHTCPGILWMVNQLEFVFWIEVKYFQVNASIDTNGCQFYDYLRNGGVLRLEWCWDFWWTFSCAKNWKWSKNLELRSKRNFLKQHNLTKSSKSKALFFMFVCHPLPMANRRVNSNVLIRNCAANQDGVNGFQRNSDNFGFEFASLNCGIQKWQWNEFSFLYFTFFSFCRQRYYCNEIPVLLLFLIFFREMRWNLDRKGKFWTVQLFVFIVAKRKNLKKFSFEILDV